MELTVIELFGVALAWLVGNTSWDASLDGVQVPRDDADWDRLLTELDR